MNLGSDARRYAEEYPEKEFYTTDDVREVYMQIEIDNRETGLCSRSDHRAMYGHSDALEVYL